MLEVEGENFNTGTVQVHVLSGGTTVYSRSVSAVAGNPGKAAGSFDIKTNVDCPGPQGSLEVVLIDSCTGEAVQVYYA